VKFKFFNGKPRPCGTGYVRKIFVRIHEEPDVSKTFEIVEQRKPWNAKSYHREETDSVILSAVEIAELYEISKEGK
jgi:hypothetical protein